MKPRLLLIAPVFFGYYKEIIREATSLGYDVDYICDAPSNTSFTKAITRVCKETVPLLAKRYFNERILTKIAQKHYDYVLLLAAMTFALTPEMVDKIRSMQPEAWFVIYQWDSEHNLPYVKDIHQYFDARYSFDRQDCLSDTDYRFLPLFYTRLYEQIAKRPKEELRYDCAYIGTAHPKKLHDVNTVVTALQEWMPKRYIYHYMPSKLKYLYHKATAPEYRGARLCDFEMQKLSGEQIERVFCASKVILDAQQAGQTGLTIRTIECIGAMKKLITTNKEVVNYDFYRPENILVFDEKKIPNQKYLETFFKTDYQQLPETIYQKYALRNWLGKVLSGPMEEKRG